MNAGRFFKLTSALPIVDWRELTEERPFIVLSPHPDDESLGAGGLIALARHHDQDVSVVLMTDGSMSHPNSQTYPHDRLIATRRAEFAKAGALLRLAPSRLFELGFPDAAAPSQGPRFQKAVDIVGEIIAALGARSLFVTWAHDPHCDHKVAAHLAEEVRRRHPALKLWSYPVWGWHLPPTQNIPAPVPKGFRVATHDVLQQKRAAIEAHVSQMTDLIDDDPDCFRFTPDTLAPFLRPYEYFIEVPIR